MQLKRRISLAYVLLAMLIAPAVSFAYTSIALVKDYPMDSNDVVWNATTQKDADASAIKGCLAHAQESGVPKAVRKCVVVLREKNPGFGSIVCGRSGCGWIAGVANKQDAVDLAFQACSKYGECPDTGLTAWEDVVGYPPVAQATSPAKTASCTPPPGRIVRSRTSCNNGDCTRTYENGCQVQFTAAQCFNPFNNNWEWKPDGC